jgi:hypothetical protein
MRTLIVFMGILLVLITGGQVFSADLESLATEGFKVVEETQVSGQFKGCDARTTLVFTNGKAFVCSTYAYSFGIYMPTAYILKNQGDDIKVLINGTAYSGTFLEQGK